MDGDVYANCFTKIFSFRSTVMHCYAGIKTRSCLPLTFKANLGLTAMCVVCWRQKCCFNKSSEVKQILQNILVSFENFIFCVFVHVENCSFKPLVLHVSGFLSGKTKIIISHGGDYSGWLLQGLSSTA